MANVWIDSAAHTYATVGMETGAVSASPNTRIVMLFDGAIVSVTSRCGTWQLAM